MTSSWTDLLTETVRTDGAKSQKLQLSSTLLGLRMKSLTTNF